MRKMRGTAFQHRLLALSAALALGLASWPLGVQAAGVGLGATGLQVTGGVEGLDYEVDDAAGMVVVKTDTPLTISGSSSTHGVRVAPGVHADITFSGVTITAPLPLDVATNLYGTASGSAATDGAQIENKTSLHLTLADGSVNTLTAGALFPAVHCGEGSLLTIDDGVRNTDSQGNAIVPEQGRVPRDCVLANGTALKKGAPLYLMASEDPGRLVANGGQSCAGIGGGIWENAGEMTFNGGIIEAYAYGPYSDYDGTGAGIGGSMAGGCTVMTFNGGTVTAKGSYHGAGIGGGLSSSWGANWDRPQMAGTIKSRETYQNTICRDIYVNGGNITAQGFAHGNAFGAGCAPGSNAGHKFGITGGNLTPITSSTSDIGAAGTDIVVTGGSFYTSKFQGTVTNGKGIELAMATVDLSGYPELKNGPLKSLQVAVDGVPLTPEYGLANNVDGNGKLYFWLPKSAQGKSLEIKNLVAIDPVTGQEQEGKYDFTIPSFDSGHTVAKQYVTFTVDESLLGEALRQSLHKQYDGLPIDGQDLLNQVAGLNIPADRPEGEFLNDVSAMSLSHQRVEDKAGEETGEPVKTGSFERAGGYTVTIDSSQFSAAPGFQESFWGHRAAFAAEITPADSTAEKVSYQLQWSGDQLQGVAFHALVRPADGMAATCKAPDGSVQFYVNGVAVGGPVTVAAQAGTEKGFAFGTADFAWDLSGVQIPARPDGKIAVSATFDGGTNYRVSSCQGSPEENPGIPVVEPPKVEGKPSAPGEPARELEPDGEITSKPGEDPGDPNTLHQNLKDRVAVPVSGDTLSQSEVETWIEGRYTVDSMTPGINAAIESVAIWDENGQKVEQIDRTRPGSYHVITVVRDDRGNTTTVDLTYLVTDPPTVVVKPENPEEPGRELSPKEPPQGDDATGTLHGQLEDSYLRPTGSGTLGRPELADWLDGRYDWGDAQLTLVEVKDKDGNAVGGIDLSQPDRYQVVAVVTDDMGNTTTVTVDYQLKEPPAVEVKPNQPGAGEEGTLRPDGPVNTDRDGTVHRVYKDEMSTPAKDGTLTQADAEKLVEERYTVPAGAAVQTTIRDSEGQVLTDIDLRSEGDYVIEVLVRDGEGNTSTVYLDYRVYEEPTPPEKGESGEKPEGPETPQTPEEEPDDRGEEGQPLTGDFGVKVLPLLALAGAGLLLGRKRHASR